MRVRFASIVLCSLSGVVALMAATPEAHKASARRFYEEVWFGHKPGVVDELFAAEYINHDPRDPDEQARAEGRKAPRESQKALASQQGESTGHIDFQIAEGDRVMTRWLWSMPLASAWERFVAGRDRVEIAVDQVFRFDGDGRIAEVWTLRDDRGIDEQMRLPSLYYFEGVAFGFVLALVGSWMLRRKKAFPGPAAPSASSSSQ